MLLLISFIPAQALAEIAEVSQNQLAIEDSSVRGVDSEPDGSDNVLANGEGSMPADFNSGNGAAVAVSGSSTVSDTALCFQGDDNSSDNVGAPTNGFTASNEVADVAQATVPLVNIIEDDEAGNSHAQMYTTLIDKDGKVVDTNDPNRVIDNKYKSADKGGQGVGLAKGDALTVHFRMAAVTPHKADGDGTGVHEDTTYTMDLPWQLVAAKQDKDGKELVDPQTPLDFFNSGDVTAKGGLYTKRDASGNPLASETGDPLYELHIDFGNVDKRVDIAGEFQYSTTVSQNVTPGSITTLTYVPGGTVSFKVNDDPIPGIDGEYGATIGAGSGGPTSYYVNASLYKNTPEGAADDVFAYKNASISLDDNMGVWVDENAWAQTAPAEGNVFNAYGDNSGPYFSLGVTYAEKTEGGSNKSAWVKADPSNIIENSNGKTVVRFSADGLQVDVTFSAADALEGSLIRADRQSYIAKGFTVNVTDNAGNEAKGIKALNLYVPTVLAGDYTGTSTNAQLSLHATADSLDALDATGSLYADLGRFSQPSGGTSTFNPVSGLEYVNSAVCTWLGSNTGSYRGNYYWLDFDPAAYNDTGVNFYASMVSFLPGKQLESDYRWLDNSGGYVMNDGTASTFMTGGAGPGTQVVGMTGSNYWQFAGTVSVGQVKGDSNLVSNSCFASGSDGGSRSDAKLQYQLKKVFADADSSQQLVVYRSVDQNGNLMRNSYGDVMYIVVDPRTNANAQRQQEISGNNWYNYRAERSNNMESAKGGSWRLHVFNAPQSNLQMTFPQYEGSFDVSDQARSGKYITDRVQVDNGSFNAESRAANEISYSLSTQQSSYMNAEWVDDTTIFWSMTMNVDNWQRWTDGKLYVSADRPLQVVSAPGGVKVSGKDVGGGYAFAKTSNGWESVASRMNTGFYQASWDQMCDGATIEQKSRNNNFSIPVERNAFDVDSTTGHKTITVGFFTKVTDRSVQSDDSFKATAQLVCHTGDATLIAGNGHSNWPEYPSYVNSLGQWAYRVSTTGATHTPNLYKNSSEAVPASDSGNIATTWTLVANNFNTSGNYTTHTNSPLLNAYYGGWYGRFAIGDTMNGSKMTDADGNEVNINAGKYTHVTRMFPSKYPSVNENRNGGGCGPIPSKDMGGDAWEKYVDGAWKAMNPVNCYWDADAPGVYRKILTTNSGGGTANSEANPMAVYVYYAGNMADSIISTVGGSTLNSVGANVGDPTYSTSSLAIEYRGLEQVKSIGNSDQLDYQTELDTEELVVAAAAAQGKAGVDAATALYNVELKNAAGFGTWRIANKNPATSTVNKAVTAGLSIKKEATGPAAANDDNGGLYASYKIDTQVGFSPSAFVNIEDHISKVADSGNPSNGSDAVTYDVSDAAAATQQDKDAVAALKKATSLKNLKVTVTEPGQSEQVIGTYDEAMGTFTFKDGWKSSVLKFGDYSEEPGSLFNGQITRDVDSDGNPQLLSAQTKISVTYDLYLDIDAKAEGDMSFRESDYYHGGALTLFNHAQAERPYEVADGTDTASVAITDEGTSAAPLACDEGADTKAAGAQSSSAGEARDVSAAGVSHVGDMYAQSVDDGISLAGGEVDGDNSILRVWPDADVQREFLADQLASKTPVAVSADKSHIEWMFYDWTGTLGKNKPNVKLDDISRVFVDDLWSDADGMDDAQKLAMRQQLAELLNKHITLSNLKVYLVGGDEKPAVSENRTNLEGKAPIYSINGTLSSANNGTATATDGRAIGFTYQQGGALTETNEQGGKDVYAAGPGFTITASELPFDSYLASTYSMDIDWQGFFRDAADKGLLDGAGNAMGTNRAPQLTVKNQVVGDRNQKTDSSAGEIKIESATFGKSVKDVDASAGAATWQLSAKTSDSVDPSELVFDDEPTFSADDEAVATAAKSATTIEDVEVSLGGTVLYKNGALTAEAINNGWTDNNLSVAIDGTHLSLTIKNADGAKVLDKGQSYEVTYRTVLDKNAFVAALVEAGGTAANAAYSIQNVASLSSGGAVLSGGSNASFKPSVPVTAEKSAATTPQGGLETQSASFTVKAGTGEASREGFTLTDQITTMYGYNDSAAAAQKAMMLSALTVKVTLANGAEESFDAAKIVNGEVAGVSLAMADGSELALNVPGSFGDKRGWKLAFDKLPAGASVTVDYTLTVDRAAYVAAGGDLDGIVTFRNAFTVSTADGSVAEDSSTGKVKVQPDVSKKGVVSSDKSEEGNPLINWSVDVRLQQIFGAVELSKLETASVKDVLDQRLKYLGVSVEDSRITLVGTTISPLEEGRDYEASFDEFTRTLEVKIKNPSEHPNVRITVKTEVIGSTDAISNSVDIYVDGELKGGDKTEIDKDLVAVTQYGSVTSAKVPTWSAVATKLVDGGAGGTPEGAFMFQLVQVDENGNAIEGGQSAIGANDADGKVVFDMIEYGPRNIAGTYWYQITEKATDEITTDYKVDDSVKTFKVTLQKGPSGDYLISSEVMNDGDVVATDGVTFNNISRQNLRVAKVDLSGSAVDGATFAVVPAEGSTFADGSTDAIEVGAGTQVKTLLAGDTYTVSEKQAPAGYEKLAGSLSFIVQSDGSYEVVSADEGWSLGTDGATVTAADAKFATWTPSAKKLVDGTTPDASLAAKFSFDAVEVDEQGNEVEGGYHSNAKNAEDGSVVFDAITFEAAGTHFYRITEKADTAGDSYEYDQTAYTVKVEVTQAADRSWSVTESVVAPEGVATDIATFDNKTKPEQPEQPGKPEQPGQPDNPNGSNEKSNAPGTGDTATIVLPALLAIVCLSLVAEGIRGKRKKDIRGR